MATFQFVARSADGRVQRGNEAAESAPAAVARLRSRGWTVVDVRQTADEKATLGDSLAWLSPMQWLPIRSIDVEISLAQLAVMLRGGLTLLAGIGNVAEQSQRARLARVWRSVARRVQSGRSLTESMAEHRCFPQLVVQLIRIGEQTGNLEPVLRRGAEGMERRRSVRNTLLTALSYPTLVLVAAIGVTSFMIFSVIPKLEQFLLQLGRKLPPMTQSLIDFSTFVRQNAVQGVMLAAVFAVLAVLIYSAPAGRLILDRLALRIPIIGHLLRLAATALVSRALGMLLQSGVTLLEGLRTAELIPYNPPWPPLTTSNWESRQKLAGTAWSPPEPTRSTNCGPTRRLATA